MKPGGGPPAALHFHSYMEHNRLSNHEQSKELRRNKGNFDKLV